MEKSEISIQEVRAYRVLKASQAWLTNRELADRAKVGQRSARAYTKKWVELGIADLVELAPGHRFRLSGLADKRNKAYTLRLEAACDIFKGAGHE